MFKDSYKEQHMLSNEPHVTLTESLWLTEPLTELSSCSRTTSEAWQKFTSNSADFKMDYLRFQEQCLLTLCGLWCTAKSLKC